MLSWAGATFGLRQSRAVSRPPRRTGRIMGMGYFVLSVPFLLAAAIAVSLSGQSGARYGAALFGVTCAALAIVYYFAWANETDQFIGIAGVILSVIVLLISLVTRIVVGRIV
jgi:hypothetical protein